MIDKFLTTKDYYVVKVRNSASDYYIKKFHQHEKIGIVKQNEAFGKYFNFFWDFIKFITGNDSKYPNMDVKLLKKIQGTPVISIVLKP